MKPISENFSSKDWINLFNKVNLFQDTTRTNQPFIKRFVDNGIKHHYFKNEAKVLDFYNQSQFVQTQIVAMKWATTFDGDFNLNDNFDILDMVQNHYKSGVNSYQKVIEFLNENYSQTDKFRTLTRFFLDHEALYYKEYSTDWFSVAEKKKIPINPSIVSKICSDVYSQMQTAHSTNDLMRGLRFVVLEHAYKSQPDNISMYIKKFSKDALFFNRAQLYLNKKKIDISIENHDISLTQNEKIKYEINLNPEFFVQKHHFTRGAAEQIVIDFIGFLSKKYKNETHNMSFRLECYCEKIEGYEKTQDHIQKMLKMLDIFAPTYRDALLNPKEGVEYIERNMCAVALKQQLDSSLDDKAPIKKLKI